MNRLLRNALFILIFIMAGCGEGETMLMSKPVASLLVSSDVTDTTPVYDDMAIYEDGTLVQQNGGIYQVGVTVQTEDVPLFNPYEALTAGDRRIYSGIVYEALYDMDPSPAGGRSSAPYYLGTAFPGAFNTTYKIYGAWNGDGSSYTYLVNLSPLYYVNVTFTLTDALTSTYDKTVTYDDGSPTEVTSVVVNDGWSQNYVQDDFFVFAGTLYSLYHTNSELEAPDTSAEFQSVITLVNREYALYYIKPILPKIPLDDKQYTSVVVAGPQTWIIKPQGTFDTVAIGHLRGDSVTVVFKDSTGTEVSTHTAVTIDGRIDVDGRLPSTYTTMILYTENDVDIEANGTIEVTVNGTDTEVGMIKAGLSVDVGFMNLEFQNSAVDNSPKRQDPYSGYIDYIEGIKYKVHSGSVDVPISRYDITDRFITSFLGSLMIVNGSKSKNIAADNIGIFDATRIIGRIKSMKMGTKVKDDDIDKMIPVPFTIEEIV